MKNTSNQLFLQPRTLDYLRVHHQPRAMQTTVLTILQTESKICREFMKDLVGLQEAYRHISFNFLTENSQEQIDRFLERYPVCGQYNFVHFTEELKAQAPRQENLASFVVSPTRKVVFFGQLLLENASFLHLYNKTPSQPIAVQKFHKPSHPLSNRDLGYLFSGLRKQSALPPIKPVLQQQGQFEALMLQNGFRRHPATENIGFAKCPSFSRVLSKLKSSLK